MTDEERGDTALALAVWWMLKSAQLRALDLAFRPPWHVRLKRWVRRLVTATIVEVKDSGK